MNEEEKQTVKALVEAYDQIMASKEACGCGKQYRLIFKIDSDSLATKVERVRALVR